MPSHTSREVLIIYGSLTTCDPRNIDETIKVYLSDIIYILGTGVYMNEFIDISYLLCCQKNMGLVKTFIHLYLWGISIVLTSRLIHFMYWGTTLSQIDL